MLVSRASERAQLNFWTSLNAAVQALNARFKEPDVELTLAVLKHVCRCARTGTGTRAAVRFD